MPLVWHADRFSWYHTGFYCQFNWRSFPVGIPHHLHHICRENEKGEPYMLLIFGTFSRYYKMVFNAITLTVSFMQLKTLGWLLGIFAIFAIIVSVSIFVFQPPTRQIFVGYLSVLSLISMFASPLFIIVSSPRAQAPSSLFLQMASFLKTHFC